MVARRRRLLLLCTVCMCTYIYVCIERGYVRMYIHTAAAAAAARRVKTRGCWEAIVLAAECCSRQDATAPLSSLVGIIAMGKLAILPRDRHPVLAACLRARIPFSQQQQCVCGKITSFLSFFRPRARCHTPYNKTLCSHLQRQINPFQ